MSFLTERYFQILEGHPLYARLGQREAIATFTEFHVICVWSYHALLKSLQREIFAQSVPLMTNVQKEAIRILSEISLEEEAYECDSGRYLSHLELYLDAMADIGANTAGILTFFDLLGQGHSPSLAARHAGLAPELRNYTVEIGHILNYPLHQRAAAFFYEGEYFIPNRFLYKLQRVATTLPIQSLLEYFEVHIEGLKHPGYSASGRLVEILTDGDETLSDEVEVIGERIMRRRIDLWDQIEMTIAGLPPGSVASVVNRRPQLHLALVP